MARLRAALLLCALCGAACSTGTDYLRNRGADLTDLVRAKVMFGPGAGLKIDVTRYFHFGLIRFRDAWAAGWADRDAGTWTESATSWGLLFGRHDETLADRERYSGSYGWFGSSDDPRHDAPFEFPDPERPFVGSLMLRGSVMLYAGLDLELRFDELIDFAAGLLVLDPSRDDT